MIADLKPKSLYLFFDRESAESLQGGLKALSQKSATCFSIKAERQKDKSLLEVKFLLSDHEDEYCTIQDSIVELFLSNEMIHHADWKLNEFLSSGSFSTPEFCEFTIGTKDNNRHPRLLKVLSTYFMVTATC